MNYQLITGVLLGFNAGVAATMLYHNYSVHRAIEDVWAELDAMDNYYRGQLDTHPRRVSRVDDDHGDVP